MRIGDLETTLSFQRQRTSIFILLCFPQISLVYIVNNYPPRTALMMSSSNLNGLSLFRQSEPESDIEADLEVDQLDSDSDPEEQVSSTKPTKTKNGSGRPGERVPGHTLLPAVRLENIIQAEGTQYTFSLRHILTHVKFFRCNRQPSVIERRVICPLDSYRMIFLAPGLVTV